VRIVIAFPPGGRVDFVARILAQGLHGVESNNWYALFAPAKTMPARIEQVNAAVRRVLNSGPYRKRLLESGAEPMPTSAGELAALVRADSAKWGRIIRDKKIKGE
jgi:tripartite-type tricarboxylate transporter receptor subunit TctC